MFVLLFYVCEYFAWIYVCAPYASLLPEEARRGVGILTSSEKREESSGSGVKEGPNWLSRCQEENQILVLWKSSKQY